MQADFVLSADSKTLASVLKEVKTGETVTYERLSKAIGRDVRSSSASSLATARRIVLREERMVFDPVRGVGLQRLNDSAIVDLSDKARDKIRRTARRTAKKIVCADYDALPREKQVKHNAALSMMGALAELSADKGLKRLEAGMRNAQGQIPAAKAALTALGGIA